MSITQHCDRIRMVVVLCCLVPMLTGCGGGRFATPTEAPAPEVITVVEQAPGVVEYAWEEPMVDAVDVPPGLDPEGHYYRPAHRQLREIRQGRWQRYSPD